MNLVTYSWNGYAINDWKWNGTGVGEWSSEFPTGERAKLKSTPVYSEVAYAFPQLSVTRLESHFLTLTLHPKSLTHTVAYLREQLKQWFNIKDFQPHQLIAYDIENGNKPWYVSGIPSDVIQNDAGQFEVTLALNDPVWRLVTSTTTGNVAVVASPNTQNLTVIGNVPAQPVITIKPTSARTGSFLYRRYVPIYNTTTSAFPFPVSTIELSNGGFNTSALVSGGKALASGDDFLVMIDSSLAYRWFGGGAKAFNQTGTLIWCNIPHSPGQVGTLLTALPNNGTTVDVVFAQTPANLAVLTALSTAFNQAFIIGNEVFTYSAANVDLVNYKITSCLRAQKGTSFASHTATVSISWIEHDVWIIYGNAAALTPYTDDRYKPIIDLTNSLNTSWVWSNFYTLLSPRPGMWTPFITKSVANSKTGQALTNVYTGNQGAVADPSTELGMILQNYVSNNTTKAETATLGWLFTHPAGFTNTSMAGNKFLYTSTGWPKYAGLYKSDDNVNYSSVWNEAIPTNLNSWSNTFTHNAVALGATYHYLQLLLSGSIAAKASNVAYLQADTVTLTLGSGILTTSINSEQSTQYQLTSQIKNNTSGEYLTLNITMLQNQTLTIDCGKKTAVLDDGTNVFAGITLSPNRINADWLNIGQDTNNKFVGTAQMVYTETGLVAETLNYTYADSSL